MGGHVFDTFVEFDTGGFVVGFTDFADQPDTAIHKFFIGNVDPAHPVAGDSAEGSHGTGGNGIEYEFDSQMSHEVEW